MLTLEHISKTYASTGGATGTPAAVKDVSFEVEDGRFYTLLGPSGCGKTTTLRMIAGLERQDSGTITIGDRLVSGPGVYVPPNRRDIGMVFQSYAIWPHMTVFQNVAFPLRMEHPRPSKAEIERAVSEALALVDLEGLAERPAPMLSGGQQQRVALARALVRKPKLLLLDEPLSNLDAKLRERMRSDLRELQRRLRITTVYVTHDQTEALFLSRRVGVMQAGQLVQEGTPLEVYGSPRSAFVADFVGSATLLPGAIVPEGIRLAMGVVRCAVPNGLAPESKAILVLREEHVVVGRIPASRPNEFQGALRVAAFLGDHQQCAVALPDGVVRGRAPVSADLHGESTVWVHLPPEHCVVIADDGWRPRMRDTSSDEDGDTD